MLDFSRTWLPFIYLYGVGGLVFTVGMFLILRKKALRLSYHRHKKWFWLLIFGFVFWFSLHAIFIILAIGSK